MRAYEFITEEELNESPGFNADGPSGTMYPRGYNLQAIGGMYRTRPSERKFFNKYPGEIHPREHVRAINDRIEGGMSFDDSLQARAKETEIDPKKLELIYKKEQR